MGNCVSDQQNHTLEYLYKQQCFEECCLIVVKTHGQRNVSLTPKYST